MRNPIEILMSEHRLIETVLGSLEAFAAELVAGGDDARATLSGYVEFFRAFADRHHHGKEENLLFVALTDHGMPAEFGPIRVMLDEHDIGRACIHELDGIAHGSGPLSATEVGTARDVALRYVAMLRGHIGKEDGVLFRMALHHLPAESLERLSARFDEFETDHANAEARQRLARTAETLIAAYPPATRVESTKRGTACGGCA
jgi:hemerythrin-like domain-containing protein